MHTFKKALAIASLTVAPVAALGVFGMLFTTATAPSAEAMPQRRSTFGTAPVPIAEMDALTTAQKALYACVIAKTGGGQSRREGDFLAFDTAYNSAAMAQQRDNYAAFDAERTNFNTVLARLKATYGC